MSTETLALSKSDILMCVCRYVNVFTKFHDEIPGVTKFAKKTFINRFSESIFVTSEST